MDAFTALQQSRLIAIFRGLSGEPADKAAAALIRGDIRLIEITMNTRGALDTVAHWRGMFGGEVRIGAGTVLDLRMAREAAAAGAQFLVAPNVDEEVIRFGMERGVEVFPGAMTPTEIVRAWKAGARAVKLFPSASLGIGYLKEIRGPLDAVPLIVTGGIRLDNIREYIEAGAFGFGIGAALVNRRWIAAGRFDEIERTARQFAQIVAECILAQT